MGKFKIGDVVLYQKDGVYKPYNDQTDNLFLVYRFVHDTPYLTPARKKWYEKQGYIYVLTYVTEDCGCGHIGGTEYAREDQLFAHVPTGDDVDFVKDAEMELLENYCCGKFKLNDFAYYVPVDDPGFNAGFFFRIIGFEANLGRYICLGYRKDTLEPCKISLCKEDDLQFVDVSNDENEALCAFVKKFVWTPWISERFETYDVYREEGVNSILVKRPGRNEENH
ncbi:MAG: hypothetical protein ACI32C_03855 [Candidatus Enteromonas sp.]